MMGRIDRDNWARGPATAAILFLLPILFDLSGSETRIVYALPDRHWC